MSVHTPAQILARDGTQHVRRVERIRGGIEPMIRLFVISKLNAIPRDKRGSKRNGFKIGLERKIGGLILDDVVRPVPHVGIMWVVESS